MRAWPQPALWAPSEHGKRTWALRSGATALLVHKSESAALEALPSSHPPTRRRLPGGPCLPLLLPSAQLPTRCELLCTVARRPAAPRLFGRGAHMQHARGLVHIPRC
jgi:hypothetical protein